MTEYDFDLDAEKDLDVLDFGEKTEEEVNNDVTYINANLWAKLERVGKKISFAKDILALFRYMRDENVSWHRKAIVVAGLIYFISPVDAIPDITPLIGYLDDLGVITALLKYLGHELVPYYSSSYHS